LLKGGDLGAFLIGQVRAPTFIVRLNRLAPTLVIRWYDVSGRRRTKATRTTSKREAERLLRA
jgi:hypothetical protein